MRRLIFTLAFMSLLLTGCTVTADRIYTVCRVCDGKTYVYNGQGEFFVYTGESVVPCYTGDLQPKPALTLVLPEPSSYTIVEQFPTVYKASYDDIMRYISTCLVSDNALYTVVSVDWKSFEMLIKSDLYVLRLIYTDDNTLRLYMQDGTSPPHLQ